MAEIAKNSFTFYVSSDLTGLTGKKARHLKEFVEILREIEGSSIFCHTHQSFREFHFAKGIFTNDFAYWVADAIHEEDLAERLASIDIRDYVDIRSLREKIIELVEDQLRSKTDITIAPHGKEFFFCNSTSIAIATSYEVWTLSELKEALKVLGPSSMFYHFFDARLRLGRKTNDFSNWIESSLEKPELAKKIQGLDPYLYTLNDLKQKIIEFIEEEEQMDSIDEILKDTTLGFIKKAGSFVEQIRKAKPGERLKIAKDVLNVLRRKGK